MATIANPANVTRKARGAMCSAAVPPRDSGKALQSPFAALKSSSSEKQQDGLTTEPRPSSHASAAPALSRVLKACARRGYEILTTVQFGPVRFAETLRALVAGAGASCARPFVAERESGVTYVCESGVTYATVTECVTVIRHLSMAEHDELASHEADVVLLDAFLRAVPHDFDPLVGPDQGVYLTVLKRGMPPDLLAALPRPAVRFIHEHPELYRGGFHPDTHENVGTRQRTWSALAKLIDDAALARRVFEHYRPRLAPSAWRKVHEELSLSPVGQSVLRSHKRGRLLRSIADDLEASPPSTVNAALERYESQWRRAAALWNARVDASWSAVRERNANLAKVVARYPERTQARWGEPVVVDDVSVPRNYLRAALYRRDFETTLDLRGQHLDAEPPAMSSAVLGSVEDVVDALRSMDVRVHSMLDKPNSNATGLAGSSLRAGGKTAAQVGPGTFPFVSATTRAATLVHEVDHVVRGFHNYRALANIDDLVVNLLSEVCAKLHETAFCEPAKLALLASDELACRAFVTTVLDTYQQTDDLQPYFVAPEGFDADDAVQAVVEHVRAAALADPRRAPGENLLDAVMNPAAFGVLNTLERTVLDSAP